MSPQDKKAIESGVESGISWRVVAAPFYGAANGYVQLPEEHPWRDQELQMGAVDVEVHGGVTYGPTQDGWIGFDTLHAWDVWPGSPQGEFGDGEHDIHWTVEMVVAEAKRLAAQVKAVSA